MPRIGVRFPASPPMSKIYFVECYESLHACKVGFIASSLGQTKSLIAQCFQNWGFELEEDQLLSIEDAVEKLFVSPFVNDSRLRYSQGKVIAQGYLGNTRFEATVLETDFGQEIDLE